MYSAARDHAERAGAKLLADLDVIEVDERAAHCRRHVIKGGQKRVELRRRRLLLPADNLERCLLRLRLRSLLRQVVVFERRTLLRRAQCRCVGGEVRERERAEKERERERRRQVRCNAGGSHQPVGDRREEDAEGEGRAERAMDRRLAREQQEQRHRDRPSPERIAAARHRFYHLEVAPELASSYRTHHLGGLFAASSPTHVAGVTLNAGGLRSKGVEMAKNQAGSGVGTEDRADRNQRQVHRNVRGPHAGCARSCSRASRWPRWRGWRRPGA